MAQGITVITRELAVKVTFNKVILEENGNQLRSTPKYIVTLRFLSALLKTLLCFQPACKENT